MIKNLKFLIKGTWKSILGYRFKHPYRGEKEDYKRPYPFKTILKLFFPPILLLLYVELKQLYKYIFLSRVEYVKLKHIGSYYEYDAKNNLKESDNIFTIKNIQQLTKVGGYDFMTLIEDIEYNGMRGIIALFEKPEDAEKYHTKDGHHRVLALKFLYGEEHKIQVIIYPKIRRI